MNQSVGFRSVGNIDITWKPIETTKSYASPLPTDYNSLTGSPSDLNAH